MLKTGALLGSLFCLAAITPPTGHAHAADVESIAPATAGQVAVARLERFDEDQYALHADEIVLATVEDLESRNVTTAYGDQIITSTAVLRVERVLKGDVRPGSTLGIEILGGTVGDVTLNVSHAVSFEPGERTVVYIARGPTQRTVLGGEHGKLHVDEQNNIAEIGQPFEVFASEVTRYLRSVSQPQQ